MKTIKRQFDCSSKVEIEHVKVLVSCLVLDRRLVESAEGMNDALLVLDRRSVNPSPGEKLLADRSKTFTLGP